MPNQPVSVSAARFPDDYAVPGSPGETGERISWSEVEEKLRAASNYWLTTVRPDGRPHARPVDGVWVGGALCFGGAPQTRWVRNLQSNAQVSVNLSSEAEAIILEGTAEAVTDAEHPLAKASTAASREKYPQYFDEDSPFHPFWALRPKRAYAWTLEGFPNRATRWNFEEGIT
jgi:general stress protein 26